MNKIAKDIIIWFLPAILLLISLLPMPLFPYYGLLLQIVVTITAAVIIFYLTQMKPKYYVIWVIVFAFIILIFNPFIRLSVIVDIAIPLALITAAIYIANWFFVFRTRP